MNDNVIIIILLCSVQVFAGRNHVPHCRQDHVFRQPGRHGETARLVHVNCDAWSHHPLLWHPLHRVLCNDAQEPAGYI